MKLRQIITLALGAALIAATAILAGCGGEAAGQDKTINSDGKKVVRIAVQPSSAFIPLYVARTNGWIEEALKKENVEVQWTDFEAGPPMNESFSAGQQDIGVIGDIPAVSAVAAGQDNVYIADINGGPAYAVLVKPDSPIKSVADLKGKKVGTVVGSTSQNLLEKLLKQSGLTIKDVELVNITAGDAQTVLTNGNVDAVSIWEPTVTRLEANKTARILADGSNVGFKGVNVIFARNQFIKDYPEIAKIVLEQYVRGVNEWKANPEKYAPALQQYFKLEPDLIVATSKKYDYKSVFAPEDAAALEDTAAFLKSIDAIHNDVDIKGHISDDLIKQVLKGDKK